MKELLKKIFPHIHKWQQRGVNRYGTTTYKVCTKCGESQKRVNKSYEDDKFEVCSPIIDLDNQFDKNNKYIFG